MRDNLSNCQAVHLGNVTVSGTTPATSAYVDLRGFGACTIAVVANTVTDAGTASGFTVTLQESADTTAAAAGTVATTDTIGAANTVTVTSDTADNTNAGGMGYIGENRYVGISVTGTTGSDADISIIALLGKPSKAATTFIGTSVART
jgi:hypothetical protein